MKCDECSYANIGYDITGGEERMTIYCEHANFVLPEMVVDGFSDYLKGLNDEWSPKPCPLGDGE